MTNEKVRELTQQVKLENIIRERRLRWAGHVMRMDPQRIARQALDWKPPESRRRPGRPRSNWQQSVTQDIIQGGFSWDEVPDLAVDRVACDECRCHKLCTIGAPIGQWPISGLPIIFKIMMEPD